MRKIIKTSQTIAAALNVCVSTCRGIRSSCGTWNSSMLLNLRRLKRWKQIPGLQRPALKTRTHSALNITSKLHHVYPWVKMDRNRSTEVSYRSQTI